LRIFDERELTTSEWATALLAALIPVVTVVALDPAGWFPSSIAKWAAVSIVALAAVTTWMWSTLGGADASIAGRSVLIAGIGLIGLIVVSSVFAVDGRYAWTGSPNRHLGSLTWMMFAILFALGLALGSSSAATTVVVRGSVIAGALLGTYTAVEAVFGAPVEFVSASVRLGGPFGSAAYLGAALCLLLPLAGAAALDSDSPRSQGTTGRPEHSS
jgi:hypothetical protein